MSSAQQDIDRLLHRYLLLLDHYTRLRRTLSELQSDIYQSLAQANFAAERGLRYGQDQYDGRMRAARRLDIQMDSSSVPVFRLRPASVLAVAEKASEGRHLLSDDDGNHDDHGTGEHNDDKEGKEGSSKPPVHGDPLRWFGILTPASLRAAQSTSVKAVEHVIPSLVSIMAEMDHLERELQQARERRTRTPGPEEAATVEADPPQMANPSETD